MAVVWSRTLEDVPAPLNLVAIMFTKEVGICCSGITCPDGTCKPKPEQCDVMALRCITGPEGA